jgi:hypothetical protein
MANASIEKRLQALEADVADLKKSKVGTYKSSPSWLEVWWGAFANDPAHEEAMRLGAEWRKRENEKSLRKRPKKKKNVRPRQ